MRNTNGQYVKFCVKSRSRVGSARILHFDAIETPAAIRFFQEVARKFEVVSALC